jgi:hypothetical protein
MTSLDGHREYTMRTRHGRLALRARFSLGDIEPIFQDRSGLRENGEVLFADARGDALTSLRYPVQPALSGLQSMQSLQRCLAGDSGEMRTRDYRDTMVISGFRPATVIGGGCIIANLQYSDVLVPSAGLDDVHLRGDRVRRARRRAVVHGQSRDCEADHPPGGIRAGHAGRAFRSADRCPADRRRSCSWRARFRRCRGRLAIWSSASTRRVWTLKRPAEPRTTFSRRSRTSSERR